MNLDRQILMVNSVLLAVEDLDLDVKIHIKLKEDYALVTYNVASIFEYGQKKITILVQF